MDTKHCKIIKFGGTSVGSAIGLRHVGDILSADREARKIVVVSAPHGVTDRLSALVEGGGGWDGLGERFSGLLRDLDLPENILHELLQDLWADLRQDRALAPAAHRDLILSYGERASILIVASFLLKRGLPAVPVDSREFMVTNSRFGQAACDIDATRSRAVPLFQRCFAEGRLPIVTGFIGQDPLGRTSTFGRGGSDLTATLLGECLHADLVEIWTDADGVMTADPRKVKDPILIKEITYKEAIELSNFGAKVLYSRCLTPSLRSGVPVRVRNTFRPEEEGTLIKADSRNESFSITLKEDIQVITVFNPEMIGTAGYLARLFGVFEEALVSVDVIAVSEASVSVTVQGLADERLARLKERLSAMGEVKIKRNCHIVAIVSKYLDRHPHLAWESLKAIAAEGVDVEMISYGNTDINLTFVVGNGKGELVLNRLHRLFRNKFV